MLQAPLDGMVCGGSRRPGSRKSRSGEFLASEEISLTRSRQHGAVPGWPLKQPFPADEELSEYFTDLKPMLSCYGPPGWAVDGRLRGITKAYLISHYALKRCFALDRFT
jgi:hypothetical protein